MTAADIPPWAIQFLHGLPTPSYVYCESTIREDVHRLAGLLPLGARTLFSLKANPQPALAALLNELGCIPEVASEGEYDVCISAGIAPERIVVGGVGKERDFLHRARSGDATAITIDSLGELQRLRSVDGAGHRGRLLLRVNPGVAIGGLDMGGDSQFGLSIEQALEVVQRREFGDNDFLGLHFYLGSQRLKPEPILRSVALAREVLCRFDEAGLSVPVVDIGLGCGVPYLDRDVEIDHASLARDLQPMWQDKAWAGKQVWSEAGRALVGRAGWFVCRVLERKELNGKVFVITDGGLNVHNPGVGLGRFLRGNPVFRFVQRSNSGHGEKVDICGSLCTSADRIGHDVMAPRLERGDLVLVPGSGAYCHTTALWGFNGQRAFSEAMVNEAGELRWLEPQHIVFSRLGPR